MDVQLQSLFTVSGKESTDNESKQTHSKEKFHHVDLLHVKGLKWKIKIQVLYVLAGSAESGS